MTTRPSYTAYATPRPGEPTTALPASVLKASPELAKAYAAVDDTFTAWRTTRREAAAAREAILAEEHEARREARLLSEVDETVRKAEKAHDRAKADAEALFLSLAASLRPALLAAAVAELDDSTATLAEALAEVEAALRLIDLVTIADASRVAAIRPSDPAHGPAVSATVDLWTAMRRLDSPGNPSFASATSSLRTALTSASGAAQLLASSPDPLASGVAAGVRAAQLDHASQRPSPSDYVLPGGSFDRVAYDAAVADWAAEAPEVTV